MTTEDKMANIVRNYQNLMLDIQDVKPNDRSNRDRRFAVAITELEKAYAYFFTYVYMKG